MSKEYLQPELDEDVSKQASSLIAIWKEKIKKARDEPYAYRDFNYYYEESRKDLSTETNAVIETLCDIISERDAYIKVLNSRLTELEEIVEQDPTPIQIAKWRMDNTE